MLGKDANSFPESGIRQANRIFTGPRVDEIPDHGGTLAELKTLQRPFCCSSGSRSRTWQLAASFVCPRSVFLPAPLQSGQRSPEPNGGSQGQGLTRGRGPTRGGGPGALAPSPSSRFITLHDLSFNLQHLWHHQTAWWS